MGGDIINADVTMRIVFMGTPDFVVPVLEGIQAKGHQVVGVYTRPDRPAGRGRGITQPPIKQHAIEHNLAVFQPQNMRQGGLVEQMQSLKPEVAVVAAYGRILPPEVLAVPPKGVLNLHPSLLPRYRGPAPVAAAILEGQTMTGVTIMLMDEGMDTGPILAQQATYIMPGEKVEQLTWRLFHLGAELLLDVLPRWEKGDIIPVIQDETLATSTRLYTKGDGETDWTLSASAIARRVRAFAPWPGCYTRWEGRTLKILEGVAIDNVDQGKATPGEVISLPEGEPSPVAVATGEGLLCLVKVQIEGRNAQSPEQFLQGYPRLVGARLPS